MKNNKYSNITDIVNRRLIFLKDTVAHYNSNNRSAGPFNHCKYHPINSNTQGCAIGRHLSAKLALSLDNMSDSSVSNKVVFYLLPKWMREMGEEFLTKVQGLHDDSENWNETGLTSQGIRYYDFLIQAHCQP